LNRDLERVYEPLRKPTKEIYIGEPGFLVEFPAGRLEFRQE
jgi:hypothetical protein